ncbi:hypothetical protein [Paenibacillus sp. 276b]|uniref:hypothetical protein n=1 Tax=Paenibacillus sp. 276b TaxID=1566277 RepID=UPI00089463AF|nr:hypothetical protein [Paenibacillus sp. 276b]SEB10104.1 hypothetical protein SAMN03159332_3504 [Paenibacillus sp. 276b]
MVTKLLLIYKSELSLRNIIFNHFNWKLIFPHLCFILVSLVIAITLAVIFNQPPYLLIFLAVILVLPNLFKRTEKERDRILSEEHNGLNFSDIRMKRLRKFLKEESIDHSKEKLNLLISYVDKQAEEKRVPFLVGRGVMAALLIPIWIQGIAWILNKQIDSIEWFVVFIIILLLILILVTMFLSFWKTIVHDEIVNSDYNSLKIISSDLREYQFKDL